VIAWQKRLGARKGIFCEPRRWRRRPWRISSKTGCIGGHDVVVVISGSCFREIGVLQSEPVTKLGADALPEDLDYALTSS
jgi:hypothetical protein